MKWSFVPKNTGKPTYLCCNADESEPGTCKDRVIIERDPHQLIEGMIIASYAVDCHLAFIYIRGEFTLGYRVLESRTAEARAKGFLGQEDLRFQLRSRHHSAFRRRSLHLRRRDRTARIAGRQARPSAAEAAVSRQSRDCTVVRPSSTTSRRWPICRTSSIEASTGSRASDRIEKNTGPKLYCVSGHVNKPAVIERELGIPLPELIYDVCGGIRNGQQAERRDSRRFFCSDSHGGRDRCPNGFRLACGEGNAARFCRLHGGRRNRLHGQARAGERRASMRKKPAGSAPSAAKAPGGWSRSCTGSNTATERCRTSR